MTWYRRSDARARMRMSRKLALATSLTIALMGILGVALEVQRVEANGSIYIKADWSVVPAGAISSSDNITYTFTGKINNSIVVERSNIIIYGAGYTLWGMGSGVGFTVEDVNNVTIQDITIYGFLVGVNLRNSSDNSIYGNSITNNTESIYLNSVFFNIFYENKITKKQLRHLA